MNAIYDSELYHHGIKGQKWGVRRYQNADGSLTAAGKKKYYRDSAGVDKAKAKKQDAARRTNNAFNTAYNYDQIHIGLTKKSRATSKANWNDYNKEASNYRKQKAAYKSAKKEYKENVKNDPELQAHRAAVRKKVAIAAGATALAAVGAYTLHKTGADKKIADSVIQAGRGMSKKAYNKFYDRPIDTKARVVPNIQKQLGTTKGQVPTRPYKYMDIETNTGRNYKLGTDISLPRYAKTEGHGPISGKKTGNTVKARSLAATGRSDAYVERKRMDARKERRGKIERRTGKGAVGNPIVFDPVRDSYVTNPNYKKARSMTTKRYIDDSLDNFDKSYRGTKKGTVKLNRTSAAAGLVKGANKVKRQDEFLANTKLKKRKK